MRPDINEITPEMARAELARRQSMNSQGAQSSQGQDQITPEMARAELQRRQQSQNNNSGYWSEGLNPIQFGKGALDALSNTTVVPAINWANKLGITNSTAQPLHSGEGLSYDAGNITGNIGSYLAPGMGAFKGLKALQETPMIGKIAQYLTSGGFHAPIARNALGGAAYGAFEHPENPSGGALQDATLAGGIAGIPAIGKGIKSGIDYARPSKQAESILDFLGKNKKISENSRLVANDIKDAYKNQTQIANALYNPVKEQAGKETIKLSKPFSNDLIDKFGPKVEEFHQEFIKEPTFNNAHKLQSEMGSKIRSLEANERNLSISDKNTLEKMQNSRERLKSEMRNVLSNKYPNLSEQYDKASNYFHENVIPYRQNNTLYKTATGDIKSPDVLSIFRKPESNAQKEDLNSIIGHLSDETKNKILYAQLGKYGNKSSPKKLSEAISKLDEQGFDSFITPEFNKYSKSLENKLAAQKWAKILGIPIGIGAIGTHYLPGGGH